jgi:hypothetical protein
MLIISCYIERIVHKEFSAAVHFSVQSLEVIIRPIYLSHCNRTWSFEVTQVLDHFYL